MYRNLLRTIPCGLFKPVQRNNSVFFNRQTVSKFKLNFFPKYICFALLNFLYVAKAESAKITKGKMTHHMSEATIKEIINQSDELFSKGKFKESFEILETLKNSENAEVLWRIARGLYNMSRQKNISKTENAALIHQGYEFIEKALKIDDKNYSVHKWMAILYDAKSALEGIKARINALPVFKKHLMRAIELNPKDATSVYMLGQYMYNIADMSRFQKLIAKTLFGTPPETTFEEAFYYFNKAEEIEPNFYSANLLMLGKTSLKLKKIEAARYWLKCVISYPVRTDEDEAARLEAEQLLNNNPDVKSNKKEEKVENTQ